MKDLVIPAGSFTLQAYNADGTPAWGDRFPNGATTAGLNSLLDVYFRAQAQLTTWYIGLISNTGFTALAITDTPSSHAGWTESTAYDEATRQTWTPGAAGGGSIINPTRPAFTISTNGTQIKGAFLISENTKGGTTGTLWATGILASVRTLNDGQILTVEYETSMVGGTT